MVEAGPEGAVPIGEDGALPDGAVVDAGAGGRRCAPGSPFGPPTRLEGLASYSVEAVRFASNRQLVYLSLCPIDMLKSGCEMFQGTTTVTPDTFGSFNPMTSVNSTAYDSYPTVSGDAGWLLFGSARTGLVRIFRAGATGGVFQNPSLIPSFDIFAAANEPYLLLDGKTLYFGATTSASPDQWDLYRATAGTPDDPSAFILPELVPGVSDPASGEYAPVVAEDELEIFFASSRPPGNASDYEIWASTRGDRSDVFRSPDRLGLGGPENDFPTSISPDACALYYIRKEPGTKRGIAYVARRTP